MSRLALIMSANEITTYVRNRLTLKLYASEEFSVQLTASFIRIRSRILKLKT